MTDAHDDFLDYSFCVYQELLEKIRCFAHKDFSFEKLALKTNALLVYEGGHAELVHKAVFHAMAGILYGISLGERGLSRIFGLSGEVSGLYEIVIKRGTMLEQIHLGQLEGINRKVWDGDHGIVKEFDAVSSNTVYEFKFHLTLHKLYQQVIGSDSARMPHLKVLTDHPAYRHIRNLVYFGEYDYGGVSAAVLELVRARPEYASRVVLTPTGGLSVKLRLEEMKDFLFSKATLALLKTEKRHVQGCSLPRGFEISHGYTERVIDDKLAQLRGDKFDIIIAVSNMPASNCRDIAARLKHRTSPAVPSPAVSPDAPA